MSELCDSVHAEFYAEYTSMCRYGDIWLSYAELTSSAEIVKFCRFCWAILLLVWHWWLEKSAYKVSRICTEFRKMVQNLQVTCAEFSVFFGAEFWEPYSYVTRFYEHAASINIHYCYLLPFLSEISRDVVLGLVPWPLPVFIDKILILGTDFALKICPCFRIWSWVMFNNTGCAEY